MKNTYTDIQMFAPKDYFEIADNFRIIYVWLFEKQWTKPYRYEVFEISCCMKELPEFWSIPIRFVSDNLSQNALADILIKNWKKVIYWNLPTYLGEWKRLMYRDIKDLPHLKLWDF